MAATNSGRRPKENAAVRRFSSRSIRAVSALSNGGGNGGEPPEVASARGLYRSRLPAVYQEHKFGLRFVGAFERVLDPVPALLDSLASHFDPDLAPPDIVELLAAWLGVELDESWADERRRELIRKTPELARRRGTARGLELALRIGFPDLPLRVEDEGGVTFSASGGSPPASKPKPPSFVVYCDASLDESSLAAVMRAIERFKPVHVSFRLRVKVPSETV